MGVKPPVPIDKQKVPALAPDGLPWPPGYFDCMPKETFEQALANYGVRPNHYLKGWPVYTQAERDNPAYICTIPPESPELEAKWKAEWEENKKAGYVYTGHDNP